MREVGMKTFVAGWWALLLTCGVAAAQGQPQSPEERVAALKANLAASQAALRQYEWIETTVVSLKGEEKSRQQNRCYHGADGALQKVPVTAPPAPAKKKRGLRGRIVENKKEELAGYMKEAVELVHQYVPPASARIQAVKDAGQVTLQPDGTNKRLKLTFAGYLKPGDSLGMDVELGSNRILGVKVSTYLASPQEQVNLDVRFSALNDGTSYPAETVLDAKAKDLRVTVQNSGYRKLAP
jgi:hypothetical protein